MDDEVVHRRRWLILGVLCFSLLVIVLDNSILNVAIPTIVRELDASSSQLQWMIDSYVLVFAGLLLTAGALGDRFGRRGALQIGLVIFGLASGLTALADTAGQVIGTRAVMGIGAALIMPATLSIITNVFPPHERGRAIGVWAGTAGLGVALGPLTGGFLLEHFYWGSIFLVNVPIVAVGLLAGWTLIPTSKDPEARPLDPVGAVLSILGLGTIVYAIIEAPEVGWTDPAILGAFLAGAALVLAFVAWERRVEYPMLDVQFFRNRRFSAASTGITCVFFALFGAMFLLTQYMQFVLGYSPLEAGVRLLPWAGTMMIVAPASARIVERVGTKVVVTTGLVLVTIGLALLTLLGTSSDYGDLVWRMVVIATGMALTMAPATESIMGSLPLGKAGVGSAVNDTTRQVGGALGVAVVGSVLSSIFTTRVDDVLAQRPVPPQAREAAESGIGGALSVAERVRALPVPDAGSLGDAIADAARGGFVDGMHAGVLVSAAATLIGAVVAFVWLPARARPETPAGLDATLSAEREPLDAR